MAIEETGNFFARWLGKSRPPIAPVPPPAEPAVPPPPPIPKGFTPIEQHEPNDIFIVGYPKSGNTWTQYLIAGGVYGVDLDVAFDSLVKDLVPDVHYRPFYKRYSPVAFFKSHALPQPDYKRVIYLLRDGRDAMVSYYHYLEAMLRQKMDYLHLIETGEHLFPCKWQDHVEQWLANPYQSEMIVVRYEDMKKNAARELARMCEFAGCKRDPAVLEAAACKASFGNLQKREKAWGREGDHWPKDKQFIRRGVIGSYADEMPPAAQAAFMSQAGGMLRQLGYIKEPATGAASAVPAI